MRNKALDERRDAYRQELFHYRRKQGEYEHMLTALQLLARDCDAALSRLGLGGG